MTDFQKANSVYDEKITQLIASLRIAVASLKDYRDEDRTYRVDAKSMIDLKKIDAITHVNDSFTPQNWDYRM
jgi:hypothetical protein